MSVYAIQYGIQRFQAEAAATTLGAQGATMSKIFTANDLYRALRNVMVLPGNVTHIQVNADAHHQPVEVCITCVLTDEQGSQLVEQLKHYELVEAKEAT